MTVHLDELEYTEFRQRARRRGQSAPELLRRAIRQENARQKRSLSRSLAATHHASGIRTPATANPDDFTILRVFTFEDWARAGS